MRRRVQGTQPYNDVVIGCASLKYFHQNSATLPNPKSRTRCESHRAQNRLVTPHHSRSSCPINAGAADRLLPNPPCRPVHRDLLARPTIRFRPWAAQFVSTSTISARRPAAARWLLNSIQSWAQTTRNWAAQKSSAKLSSRPTEMRLRTTLNHHFLPHASHTRLSGASSARLQPYRSAPIIIFCHG